jgi:predicted GNAT family N-acyltransferase
VASAITLQLIEPSHALYAAERDLRFRVLRAPLGFTPGSEVFPFETESLHLVAVRGGDVVGCVLFHLESATAGRLFQMAVREDLQQTGLGRRLVEALESTLRERGVVDIYLHARANVTGFYERLGYVIEGEPFDEVGIPHRRMHKDLTRA